ncbi:DUF2235 domain-containing protein [Caballeronia concitans]|uniref:T6SS Phospholipase effector Tle1-like catalytic domain-containing protein n=1 Tax=Caballeronia concitans TaxID=1777133 RepID=A0A658QXZ6_9BURK|nr:DUF2235 domain-containing protein [Caballeronia concitans]KIG11336.1 Protein of unknown function DUF2235 [Burkholderia sp. MR1]SAL32511.1 hypothetical protein AWB72_02921 [Caballeronia concitans]
MTKLALFFDGTWNEPNDRTNAYLLYKLAPETDDQETLYVPGVGTQGNGLFSLANKFLGGAFGDGLSDNIKSGYAWLCQRYQPGASIYIFGFSRGAYSARSLAGLIRKCGLANDWSGDSVRQAYGIYRDQSVSADDDSVKAYRQQFSREVDVAFIGVWDTVGELGIPIGGIAVPGFASYYKFHDTTLSNRTKAAYHAIAANEFRSLYKPTLWTQGTEDRGALPLEQRWFAGAHANVGGGYVTPPRDPADLLPLIPAEWLRQKAESHGLGFDKPITIPDAAYASEPIDSYTEFTSKNPLLRDVCQKVPRAAGTALNEKIDPSLFNRLDAPGFLDAYPALREQLRGLPLGE